MSIMKIIELLCMEENDKIVGIVSDCVLFTYCKSYKGYISESGNIISGKDLEILLGYCDKYTIIKGR